MFAALLCSAWCVHVQEAKEREWRAKEKAAAERQAAMTADLAAAREAQMRSKLVAQATMAQVEETEFMRVLTVNKEKEQQQRSQVRPVELRHNQI
jgi:hypothetical protein